MDLAVLFFECDKAEAKVKCLDVTFRGALQNGGIFHRLAVRFLHDPCVLGVSLVAIGA